MQMHNEQKVETRLQSACILAIPMLAAHPFWFCRSAMLKFKLVLVLLIATFAASMNYSTIILLSSVTPP
jgi:hypothetical protein